ncbi:MAG: FmdB family transcriptional regulator [Gemmatimonadetes bacterium]|nr:FmdB family transcriptional regulator [Gemmatimonadota bacterium]
MPTYEYRCDECDHEFEEFQSIKADPLDICPECEGSVKRLISAGGAILFKGDGFYITDYRSDDYKKAAKKDAEAAKAPSTEKEKKGKKKEGKKEGKKE